jgi:hypothetical protein
MALSGVWPGSRRPAATANTWRIAPDTLDPDTLDPDKLDPDKLDVVVGAGRMRDAAFWRP